MKERINIFGHKNRMPINGSVLAQCNAIEIPIRARER